MIRKYNLFFTVVVVLLFGTLVLVSNPSAKESIGFVAAPNVQQPIISPPPDVPTFYCIL